jgi:hypothetical protein
MSSTAEVEPSTNPNLRERIDQGAAARERTPLALHADFAPAAGREALTILERQASSRVRELVPVRYGRMLGSPFSYFRGAAAVMAADLAATPTSGLVTTALWGCPSVELRAVRIGGAASCLRRQRLR